MNMDTSKNDKAPVRQIGVFEEHPSQNQLAIHSEHTNPISHQPTPPQPYEGPTYPLGSGHDPAALKARLRALGSSRHITPQAAFNLINQFGLQEV